MLSVFAATECPDARTFLPRRRTLLGAATALLLVVCPLASGPATAQTSDELRALRDDIQRQRAELEAERKKLEEQNRKLEDALDRLEALEADKEKTPPAGAVAATPPPPMTEEEKAELSHLEIYGFAQVDAIHDFDNMDPDWESTLRPSKIPVVCPGDAGCGNNDETNVSAKQSRVGLKGFVPTKIGDINTQIEIDFFATGSDAGSHNVRLRHAWGSLGPILGGQTNSLFMDGSVFPNVIDYWGPAGMIFLRNPQIRYTPFADLDGWELAVALEQPGNAVDEGKAGEQDPNLDVDDHNEWPDGTMQARYTGDWGHVQGSAIFRGVGFQVRNNPGADPSGTKFGWGLSGSAGINTIGRDQILLQLTYGEAIANYFNDGGNDLGPDGNLTDAKTIPSLGWMAYYNRFWNDEFSSAVGYSEHRQNNTNGQADSAFKTGQYFSVNTLYSPIPDFMTGLEFLWGRRENNNDKDSTDIRLQYSLKYTFGATIYGSPK